MIPAIHTHIGIHQCSDASISTDGHRFTPRVHLVNLQGRTTICVIYNERSVNTTQGATQS
jgi:hypothetical protein